MRQHSYFRVSVLSLIPPPIAQTCFFRQFGRSVVRADYLTLRRGFIQVIYILWDEIPGGFFFCNFIIQIAVVP